MMNFSDLLSSDSSAVRRRAMMSILRVLETRPLTILTNFEKYSKHFLDLFFTGKEEGRMQHSSITPLVIKATYANLQNLQFNSFFSLFHYFVECMDKCEITCSQISYVSSSNLLINSEDPNSYKYILELILPKIVAQNKMGNVSLHDYICLIKNEISVDILKSQENVIKTKIIENIEYGIPQFIELVQNECSMPLPLNCIKSIYKENPKLSEKILFKHFQFLKAISDGEISIQEATEDAHESSSISQIRGILQQAMRVENWQKESSEGSKTTGDIQKDFDLLSDTIKSVSSLTQFKEIQAVNFSSEKKTNKVPTQPVRAPKNLECYAEKKGGLRHNSWQRRYFKFYHSNNCIVWRDEPNSKEIKGVLILTTQSQVNLIVKNGSRHENRLSIVPGESQKNYILAFDSLEQAKSWQYALLECCKSK